MNQIKNTVLVIFFGLGLIVYNVSCSSGGEYYEMESRELASGVRHDSLFLGIYLGMSSDDFYAHCWDLNKQGLVREGNSNASVFYPISTFEYPASMDFYPIFHNESIVSMPITFSYDGWAPWNKHLYADSLKVEVLNLMQDWYGTGFLEISNPHSYGGNAFVKVDGNRRISIYNAEEQYVTVDIVDLPVWKEIKKNGESK